MGGLEEGSVATRFIPTRQGVAPEILSLGAGVWGTVPATVTRRAALAAALVAILAGRARAEPPEAAPPREAGPATAPAGKPSDEGETWLDESHRYIERDLLGPVVWRLDSFFGEERPGDLDPAGSVVRWRSESRGDSKGHLGFRSAVLVDLRLPAAQRWLEQVRLVFEGESTADPSRPYTDTAANPGFSPTLRAEQAHLELRQVFVRSKDMSLDTGGGVRLRVLPDPFARIRFRRRQDLGAGVEARIGQTVGWQLKDGFSANFQLDLARSLGRTTALRANNGANLSEVSSGLEWYDELGLAQELPSLRAGLWFAGAIASHTRPRTEVAAYRLYARARRDLWRRWIFVELEPEVAWPLDPVLGRIRVFAITVRAEVHFEGRSEPLVVEPGRGGG